MKALLARFSSHTSLGLYVWQDTTTVSVVSHTAFGPVELFRARGTGRNELKSLLRQAQQYSAHPVVVLALDLKTVFHATRAAHHGAAALQAQQILRQSLTTDQAANAEMLTDVVRVRNGDRDLASVAACDAEVIDELQAELKEVGLAPSYVEPATVSLLRTAQIAAPKSPKRALVIRIFLGENEGLGLLTSGNLPVIWRKFVLEPGNEATALLSIARSLEPLGKYCGADLPLDSVIVHGRSDLQPLLDEEWLEDRIGASVRFADGPAFQPEDIAYSAACRPCIEDASEFNLIRGKGPSRSPFAAVPWVQVAVQCTVVVALALFHLSHISGLRTAIRVERSHNAALTQFAASTEQDLRKEKNELTANIKSIEQFNNGRICWHNVFREISDQLPGNVYLRSLQGANELELPGKGEVRPRRSLQLQGAAPVAAEGATAQQIEAFIQNLRQARSLKPVLPRLDVAALQTGVDPRNHPVLTFSVSCLGKSQPQRPTPENP